MAKMEVVYSLRELKEALINYISINHSIDMEDVKLFIPGCDQPDAWLDDDEAMHVVCEF